MAATDPLAHVPSAPELRGMIAELVQRTELLRQMYRLAKRRDELASRGQRVPANTPQQQPAPTG